MTNILNASLYVGTYAKYNAGSIAGKWMNLRDYTTKRAFYDACKELHKDEADPEFMFQDHENIPAYLVSESSIDDEVWHVINSLKKFAPDRAEEFAQWCDDNGAEQDYNALREFLGFNQPKDRKTDRKTKTQTKTNSLQMDRAQISGIIAQLFDNESDRKYYTGETSNAAYIGGKLVLFEKPSIQTQFPFDDEDKDDINMCGQMHNNRPKAREYFLRYNLNHCQELYHLDYFEKEHGSYAQGKKLCICKKYKDGREVYVVYRLSAWELENMQRLYPWANYTELTPDELKQYHKLLKNEKAQFTDRLQKYLKRYGTTKVHAWTYWANA